MSLIDCKECGRKVSTKADKCPHCGSPIENPINNFINLLKSIGYLFLAYGFYKLAVAFRMFGDAFR
jgi:predicted amidophosphoribosyltransferase